MIKKRHLHVTEEMLKGNPNMSDYNDSSLKTRQLILAKEIPNLGKEAAEKAIEEWGRPKSKITHVIFATSSDVDLPGSDHHLSNLLGLDSSVKRLILRQGGCHAGGTVLRIAKDIAENNRGARVLVVCSESTTICFQAPTEIQLVPQAIFGDGAGAMIIGADPNEPTESPIFELMFTSQTTLPNSSDYIQARLSEVGMIVQLDPDVPGIISRNIENVLIESLKSIGIDDWNSIFWIAHPGGPAILDQVEVELKLEKSKLSSTRHVLREFGNMWGASVIFVMDEMRKRSVKECKATTGEGLDWGVLLAFGPGITVETVVLRSVPLANY